MKNSGVININKPEGYTSHDVVAKLRRKLGIKRVGHTGTLDPMATGVLPICFGKDTRLIEYYDHDWKTYEAELELGKITDTLDITGEVLEEREVKDITSEDIELLACRYRGTITQIPPKYSALKVNGRPLYKYAREGQEIDIEAKKRQIEIKHFTFKSIDIASKKVSFTVTCSKGTYIRSICSEIGELLGVGATMTRLVRTKSGVFTYEASHDLEKVLEMSESDLDDIIISGESTILNLRKLILRNGSEPFYFNGRTIEKKYYMTYEDACDAIKQKEKLVDKWSFDITEDELKFFEDIYRLYNEEGTFLGTCLIKEDGSLKPEKVMGNRN